MAFQSKSPGFSRRCGFVGAIVKDDRRAHAMSAIAVNGRHVRAGHAIVRKVLVKRLDAHSPDALGDQIADRIIDHRRRDAGVQSKAIGEIGRDVELTAADVNLALGRLAKRDDAGIKAMHEGAEGKEIETPVLGIVSTGFSRFELFECRLRPGGLLSWLELYYGRR